MTLPPSLEETIHEHDLVVAQLEAEALAAERVAAAYVALRRRLHQSGLLRCDWSAALRR